MVCLCECFLCAGFSFRHFPFWLLVAFLLSHLPLSYTFQLSEAIFKHIVVWLSPYHARAFIYIRKIQCRCQCKSVIFMFIVWVVEMWRKNSSRSEKPLKILLFLHNFFFWYGENEWKAFLAAFNDSASLALLSAIHISVFARSISISFKKQKMRDREKVQFENGVHPQNKIWLVWPRSGAKSGNMAAHKI